MFVSLKGDPAGHHVIIVDDLVMTGGTLVECAKVRISLITIFFYGEINHLIIPPPPPPMVAQAYQYSPFHVLHTLKEKAC